MHTKFGACIMDTILRTTPTPNPSGTLKFQLIFVERDAKGVVMIIWTHFLLLVLWRNEMNFKKKS